MHVKDLAARFEASLTPSAAAAHDSPSLPRTAGRVSQLRDRLERAVISADAGKESADGDVNNFVQPEKRVCDSVVSAAEEHVARGVARASGDASCVDMPSAEAQVLSRRDGMDGEADGGRSSVRDQRGGVASAVRAFDTSHVAQSSTAFDAPPHNNTSAISNFEPASLEYVEPIPDVSDGDLDDIDGVERVDDYDSQDEQEASSDDDNRTFRRANTVEILSDNDSVFEYHSDHDRDARPTEHSDSDQPQATQPHSESISTASTHSLSGEFASPNQSFSTSPRPRRPRPHSLAFPPRPSPQRPTQPHGRTASSFSPAEVRSIQTGGRHTSDISPRFSLDVRPQTHVFAQAPRHVSALTPADVRRSVNPPTRHQSDLHEVGYSLDTRPLPKNGSSRRLPKAKVVIARRRTQGGSVDGHTRQSSLAGDVGTGHGTGVGSLDEVGVRKLVREYSNPKELLEGQVSLVDISVDDDEDSVPRAPTALHLVPAEGNGHVFNRRHTRQDDFRNKYDEFMDAEAIGERPGKKDSDDPDELYSSGGAKMKYKNKKRLFGGKHGRVEKDRHRTERHDRQQDAVARRSTMLSGALDRVSMAADPWIDFITDANTTPVTGKATGPLRRAMKRLFGRTKPGPMLKK